MENWGSEVSALPTVIHSTLQVLDPVVPSMLIFYSSRDIRSSNNKMSVIAQIRHPASSHSTSVQNIHPPFAWSQVSSSTEGGK